MNARPPGRYGLFEMVIVLLVIAIVAGAGFRHFSRIIDAAWAASMQTQAQVFASAVGLIHWAWVIKGGNYLPASNNESAAIMLEDTSIYVNKFGWPTHTNRVLSRGLLTAQGCMEVWNAIMRTPGDIQIAERELKPSKKLQVYLSTSTSCRYIRYGQARVMRYFDYDVISGQVSVVSGE